ncbi:MAG: OmpA family protein [Alphaproteobacteria bacterium GM7ARS4]|nr:OmpA family protein [Alphaproteobacteria bacterium GM7ARS4]
MVVFLLIAISYRISVDRADIIAKKKEEEIFRDLQAEFADDLKAWDAIIPEDATLTIRFQSPTILFEQGGAEPNKKFKDILRDFCPRYIEVLYPFRGAIDEIRIEGHTSSEWKVGSTLLDAYMGNMELSQKRALNVLDYCRRLDGVDCYGKWIVKTVTANGLSFSRLIKDKLGREDREASRRVDFAVRTTTRARLQ